MRHGRTAPARLTIPLSNHMETPTHDAPPVDLHRLVRHWYVCHPDGQDLGLIAPRFDTEAEAIAKRDRWNIDVPGHYVMGITEAPPEFSSLPERQEH